VTNLDAVVVGGGISGLAVADGLVRSGLTVQVLEARSRTGGRLETVAVPDGMADLGATWFWPAESRVQELVAELGLAIHDQWLDADLLYVRGQQVERIDRAVAPPAFRFSGGALQLANGLSAQLPDGVVRLDSPVRRIDRGDGLIRAHLADHQLEARVAVIALPPALAITSNLIHGDDLQPAVTAVLADIPVWMGLTVEAVAVYEEPFWRAAGLSGTAMCPGLPLQEIHDMSGPDGSPVLQQPAWDGQLYWTSTETASIAPGHIEGALEAAERTVAAIVQTLG